jgi:hypothetical protein
MSNTNISPGAGSPDHDIPRNLAQPPYSSLIGRSIDAEVSNLVFAPGFDASAFVNSPEFCVDDNVDGGHNTAATGVDWENFDRTPSGSSIIDTHSVSDDSGRTFHGYKEGKYFLPNDAVSPHWFP